MVTTSTSRPFTRSVLRSEDIGFGDYVDHGMAPDATASQIVDRLALQRAERRETPVPIHYCGFNIPNKFVFGYGLDLDDYYRNLPFVGVVDTMKYHLSG